MSNKKKLLKLMNRVQKDPKLAKAFEKDPVAFFEKNNINTDDLPPEVMEKISGGFLATAATLAGICAALGATAASGMTAYNQYDQVLDRHKDDPNW